VTSPTCGKKPIAALKHHRLMTLIIKISFFHKNCYILLNFEHMATKILCIDSNILLCYMTSL